MNNYLRLDDSRVQLPFGVLSGVTSMEAGANGTLRSVILQEKNVIVTHAGDLYAAYTETPRRKRKPSVRFHPSGLVQAIALEEQQEVLTPIGGMPAELVTFYESGELHRVFPVDGQISGFWTEEEERGMNIPLTFDLGFSLFTALLSSLCFYKSGAIKSFTLYPGESITVQTRLGTFPARHGFSLHENGALRSFEPAEPVRVQTPVGTVTAYDPLAHGVHADLGSVAFSADGTLTDVRTASNRILAQPQGGAVRWHAPVQVPHFCSDDLPCFQPLRLSFASDTVTITDGGEHTYRMDECHFHVSPFSDGTLGCSPADCASCSLCSR